MSTSKAKRKRTKKPPKPKGVRRIGRWISQNRLLFAIILLVIAGAIGGLIATFNILGLAPSEEGYAVFTLYDGETGDQITGEITIVNINESDTEILTVDTGETAFIPEGSIAFVSSVTLITDVGRTFLPKHFTPLVSQDILNPQNNTIIVWFLLDRDDITANITKLAGVPGNYNETDLIEETVHTFDVQINVSIRNTYSIYGDFSYMSDLSLNSYTEHKNADLNIYGLWLCFNGTELTGPVKVDNVINPFVYYVSSENITMVLLNAVFGETDTQTIQCELKDQATNVFIYQGMLDTLDSTFKVLGIKN